MGRCPNLGIVWGSRWVASNELESLSVRNTTPRVWSDYEVELVREVAERTWIAIERAKAEEALKKSEKISGPV